MTEDLVPTTKLVKDQDKKPTKTDLKPVQPEKMPSFTDPIGLIKYFIKRVYLFFAGTQTQKQDAKKQLSWTTILEIAGTVIGAMVLCCCCCCVALYGLFQYVRSSAPVPAPKKAGVKVKSSKKKGPSEIGMSKLSTFSPTTSDDESTTQTISALNQMN